MTDPAAGQAFKFIATDEIPRQKRPVKIDALKRVSHLFELDIGQHEFHVAVAVVGIDMGVIGHVEELVVK